MEKPKTNVSPQETGMKVVVRAKGKPTTPVKEKTLSNHIKPVIGKKTNKGPRNEPLSSNEDQKKSTPSEPLSNKIQHLMDSVIGQNEFKKIFKAEEPQKNNVIEWGSSNNPFSQKRHLQRRPPFPTLWQLLLSIGGAILVGIVMGFSVLSLFFSDKPAYSNHSIDNHLPNPSVARVETKNDTVRSATNPGKVMLSLPDLHVVMLQAGNFSEKAGAQKNIQSYRTRGLAAVMSNQAPYRIYLGVGQDRDDALKLSAIYQQQDVNVYLKDFNVKGSNINLSKSTSSSVFKKLPYIIQTGHQLMQELGKASVSDLNPDPKQVTTFTFTPDMLGQHKKFITDCQSMEAALPKATKERLQEMTRAIDQAVQSGQMAKISPSQALLWQIQEGLVRYASAYEEFVQTLKNSPES